MNIQYEFINCDFCNSSKFSFFAEQKDVIHKRNNITFKVLECKNCGLKQTNPRPTKESISYFYSNKYSFHSHSIPCEGYLAWTIANRYITGLLFKLRTGCNYNELMSHEHVNNYDEIYSIIKFFYSNVNVNYSYPFFISPHTSFYANISFSRPRLNVCKKYLKLKKIKI